MTDAIRLARLGVPYQQAEEIARQIAEGGISPELVEAVGAAQQAVLPFASYQAVMDANLPTPLSRVSAIVNGALVEWVRQDGGPSLGGGWAPAGEVWAEHFGAVADYNPETGDGTDNSYALNAALAWADYVRIRPGFYKVSDTVTIPPYKRLTCVSSPGNPGGDATRGPKPVDAAYLIPRNVPRRHFTDAMITEGATTGGVVPNPLAGSAYTAPSGNRLDSYRLIDLTNQDAVGATPATERLFSVALEMSRGSVVDGVRVLVTARGGALVLNGTTDATNWGHQTDVAVMARNAYFAEARNCQSIGAFRIAGLLVLVDDQTAQGETYYPQTDLFRTDNCIWQGHKSVAIRGADVLSVSAVSAAELRTKWFRSHRFAPSGSITAGGVEISYSVVTHVSGDLVFGGLSLNPVTAGVAVGDELTRGQDARSYGSGGTSINGGFVQSLRHPSFKPSTDGSFDDFWPCSGALLEVSGVAMRGIHFRDLYMHCREDVAVHFDRISDVYFEGGYHEAKYSLLGDASARWIALSKEAKIARGMGFGGSSAGAIHFIGWSQTESHTDRRPRFRTANSYGRFGTGTGLNDGLFEPGIASDDTGYNYGQSPFGVSTVIRAPAARGSHHPFVVAGAGNAMFASMDQTGQWAFGPGAWNAEAGLPYLFNLHATGPGALATVNIVTTAAGTARFRLQNTVGSASLVIGTTGAAEIRTNDVVRASFDISGFHGSVPGPYADDAAAAAGGVAVGHLYRVTGGTIAWRQV